MNNAKTHSNNLPPRKKCVPSTALHTLRGVFYSMGKLFQVEDKCMSDEIDRIKTKWELVRMELDEVSKHYSEIDRAFGKCQFETRMFIALVLNCRELTGAESNELAEFRRWMIENQQDVQLHGDAFTAHVKLYIQQMERMINNDQK